MAVLLVDDAAVDRRMAAKLLERAGYDVEAAASAEEALAIIERSAPEAVVTDLVMPGLSGLELLRRVNASHPDLPVILMTAHGSEDLAIEALRIGASGYVPKRRLAKDLAQTVKEVLGVAHARRNQQITLQCLTRMESCFELDSDRSVVEPLIAHFQDCLTQLDICRGPQLLRVATALHEALANAIEHGNLELDSQLRERGDGTYYDLARRRAAEDPYRRRRVRVSAVFTREEARFVVEDEGPGFDTRELPDPRDPANLEKASGRGLLLIRAFMDEVTFNEQGNRITMVKRREKGAAGEFEQ